MSDRREAKEKLFQGYLFGCFETVKAALKCGDFESLKDVHFWKKGDSKEAHIPDYSNPVTVAYYQLRYACGYAFDYYCAYRVALEWLKQIGVTDFSAVSLGCGSGLDRYSIELAAIDSMFGNNCYFDKKTSSGWAGDEEKWIGIDIAKWGKPDKVQCSGFPAHDNVIKVLEGGVTEYFKSFADCGAECPRNIFLFPRVLSELDEFAIQSLAEEIGRTSFSHDRMIVCIANRSDAGKKELASSQKVIHAFESSGMKAISHIPQEIIDGLALGGGAKLTEINSEEGSVLYRVTDGNEASSSVSIKDLDIWGFSLPYTIGDFLRESEESMATAHEQCPNRTEKCIDSCEHVENRRGKPRCPLSINPISLTTQMNLQIVLFKREGA